MQFSAGEEKNLIIKAKAGDKPSFEALVLHYRPHAVRFAQSLLGDAWLAEDIAQESFARVWLRLSDFKPGTSFKGWLFAIIRNLCIDYKRRLKNECSLPEEWDLPGGIEPEAVFEERELWDEFLIHYNKLSPDARMAIYLFSVESMPYSDIAKVMNKNSVQIKTLIYRSRKKLKEKGAHSYD